MRGVTVLLGERSAARRGMLRDANRAGQSNLVRPFRGFFSDVEARRVAYHELYAPPSFHSDYGRAFPPFTSLTL